MKTLRQISKQLIYDGRVVHLEKLFLRTPKKKLVIRELIRHPGAAVIIPVLDDGRLVMLSQHRIATNRWILEFPAGTLEKNEKPETCAYRETIEETGFRPGKLIKLVDFYPAPGISTERMHIYCATHLKPAKKSLDDDEFLKTRIVPLKTLGREIAKGKVKDGKTIVGFFYFCMNCLSKREAAKALGLDFAGKSR